MLSDKQYDLLSSQDSEIKGISEQKSRIIEKADKMMTTLGIILRSSNIDQELKDEIFPKHKITSLINNLTHYDHENTALQESNKQAIVIDLMDQALRYFQDRYKEVFIKKEIKNFEEFAKDITELFFLSLKLTIRIIFCMSNHFNHLYYIHQKIFGKQYALNVTNIQNLGKTKMIPLKEFDIQRTVQSIKKRND